MNAPIFDPTTTIIEQRGAFVSPPPGAEPVPTSADGARYSVFTIDRKRAFLRNLQLFGNVRNATRAACVSAQTAYRARRQSAQFRLLWDAALLAARGAAEATLADRAINGVEEAVYYHGEEVARRRRYDSRLLLAHLARLDRLEEREEVSAMLETLDDCIDALGEGVGVEEALARAASQAAEREASQATGREAGNCSQGGVPPVPSCRNGEPEAEDADGPGPELEPVLEQRLQAMEAARPDDAVPLADLACAEVDIGLIEAAQLDAFEAGEPLWWEAMPQPLAGNAEDDDPASATHSAGVSWALLRDKERD